MSWIDEVNTSPSGGTLTWVLPPMASQAATATLNLAFHGNWSLTGTSVTITEVSNFTNDHVVSLNFATGSTITIDDSASSTIGYAVPGVREAGSTALFVQISGKLYEMNEATAASNVAFTPYGRISSTTVQDAIKELIDESPAIPVSIADGGTAGTTATTAFNNLSPVTTRGDIIKRGATNNERLGIGAANTVLKSDGTDPSWTADPTVTSIGIGTSTKGIVAIGANELGFKISSTNELSLDASRLCPVTTRGLDLGDVDQRFDNGYFDGVIAGFRGVSGIVGTGTTQELFRLGTTSNKSGGLRVTLVVEATEPETPNYGANTTSYYISWTNKAGTVTAQAQAIGTAGYAASVASAMSCTMTAVASSTNVIVNVVTNGAFFDANTTSIAHYRVDWIASSAAVTITHTGT